MALVKMVFLLLILLPVVTDFGRLKTSKNSVVSMPAVSRLPVRDLNDSDTSEPRFKSGSNTRHLENLTERCNISIRDIAEKKLEFSKLLSGKMTQYVDISILYVNNDSSTNEVPASAVPGVTLIWINNEIGKTIFSFTHSLPQYFVSAASFGTLMIGKQDFEIYIEEESQGCLKQVNQTYKVEQLEDILSKLGKPTDHSYFVICKPNMVGSTKVINIKACASLKSTGFIEVSTLDHIFVFFCFILSPLALVRVLAFIDNQTEERIRVPHNYILCKILRKLCYKSVVPKVLLLLVCSYLQILKWFETRNPSYPFLVTVFLIVGLCSVLSVFFFSETDTYAFEEKFFELLIPSRNRHFIIKIICLMWNTCVKLHNVAFQPCRAFSYRETFEWSDIRNSDTLSPLEDFVRILLTSVLIIGMFVSSLSLILVVRYTFLGILLNHEHYLPSLTLYIIVAFHIQKSFQSFCKDYSLLLIKLYNVCEKETIARDLWECKEGIPSMVTDLCEEVRKQLLPFRKRVFKLIVQTTFIVYFFASFIFNGCKFLEDIYGLSGNVKAAAMFGMTILPHILSLGRK